jgi:hypothetical protein
MNNIKPGHKDHLCIGNHIYGNKCNKNTYNIKKLIHKIFNIFFLEDLIIANINLKSHKFDYWYELYIGINVEEYDDYVVVSLDYVIHGN